MRPEETRRTVRFALDTKFDVTPQPAGPYRATAQTELEMLRERLLRELLNETTDAELNLLFRHAATEAVAIAVATGFPLLLLPALFEEKAEAARRYTRRHAGILRESSDLTE